MQRKHVYTNAIYLDVFDLFVTWFLYRNAKYTRLASRGAPSTLWSCCQSEPCPWSSFPSVARTKIGRYKYTLNDERFEYHAGWYRRIRPGRTRPCVSCILPRTPGSRSGAGAVLL